LAICAAVRIGPLRRMRVLSCVSVRSSSEKPTTLHSRPGKPDSFTVWPTRKPCAFQSNGSGRVRSIPPASPAPSVPAARAPIVIVPVSFTGSSGSSVPCTSSSSLPEPSSRLTTSIVLFAPLVSNVPSTNWTVPKPMPPGKIAGSPKVWGLPLE
jgi:hypothetical protein